MKNLEYPYTIEKLPKDEGGGWLITFPDLPGCMADGETIEEAVAEGNDAVKAYLHTCKECGDPIPEPGGASQPSGRFVLRMPVSTHLALQSRAKAEKVSLNTMALSLIERGLGASGKRPKA